MKRKKESENLESKNTKIRQLQKERLHLLNQIHTYEKEISRLDFKISKLEKGIRNPSISLLQRLAEGMGMVLNVSFTPKTGSTLKSTK